MKNKTNNKIKSVITGTKLTAILLCLTTVFTLFTAGAYAGDTGAVYIDETTLVIEDGKVVSGDKSLVENGIVVIGDSDGDMDTDGKIDSSLMDKLISAVATSKDNGSTKAEAADKLESDTDNETESTEPETDTNSQPTNRPVKDNSAIISPDKGEENNTEPEADTTLPTETPTAVNPNLPEESVKNAMSINWPNLGYATYSGTGTSRTQTLFYSPLYVRMTQEVLSSAGKLTTLTYQTTSENGSTGEGGLCTMYRLSRSSETFYGVMLEAKAGKTFNIKGTSTAPVYVDGKFATSIVESPSFTDLTATSPMVRVSGKSSFLNMTYVTLQNAKSNVNGAGLYVGDGGTATLNNCAINNCDTTGNGGAIYVESGGTLNMTGGTIQNCSAANGGAIYVAGTATLNLDNVVVKNNSATNGGGMYYAGGTSTITVTNDVRFGNTDEPNTATNGGGIYVASGTLTYNSTSPNRFITNDNSATNGGGIYVAGGKLKVVGGNIGYNYAANGGGVYVANGGQFEMTGGLIYHNDATGNGGGMWVGAAGAFEISGGSIYTNTTDGYGAGLYFSGTVTGGAKINANTAAVNIYSNVATKDGGGITVQNTSNIAVTIGGGANNVNIYSNKGVRGGGIRTYSNQSGTMTVTIAAKTYIYSNEASAVSTASYPGGGGVFIGGNTNLSVTGGQIYANTAYHGAGMYITAGGSVTMSNGAIGADTADNANTSSGCGGGVYIGENGAFAISGGKINSNQAAYGGGMYAAGGSVTISGGSIYSNIAETGNGGGGWIGAVTKFEMTGGKIYLNSAPRTDAAGIGGGLFFNRGVAQGAVSITGGEIYQNSANYLGGGIYFGNGEEGKEPFYATLGGVSGSTVKIYNNICNGRGGGVCVDDGYAVSGAYTTVTIGAGTEIYSNTSNEPSSSGMSGGGMYLSPSAVVTMTGGSIYSNTGTYGTGVCINSGSFTMSDGEIRQNNAGSGNGGGVLVSNTGTFNLQGGTVTGNSAENGGGIYVGSEGTLNQSGGSITSNVALTTGGGVSNNGTFNLSGGNIYKNNCANGGGIAVLNGATLTMTGGTIGDTPENTNIATQGGGVYVAAGGTFNMSNGTIQNHRDIQDGGGVANFGTFNLSGGTITGNYATENGGGVCIDSAVGVTAASSPASFVMTGGVVSGNYNTAGNGGGIWVGVSKKFEMTAGTVSGNHTQAPGGNGAGIFVNRSVEAFSITGGTFSGNICEGAESKGGGICISNSSMASATNVTISNISLISNQANKGGGLFANGNEDCPTLTVALENITVQKNTANTSGGGIYLIGAASAYYISGDTLIGGSAENANISKSGGGIMLDSCVLNINGTTDENTVISYNQTSDSDSNGVLSGGGGVYTYNATLNMLYGSISNNNSSANDSAGGGLCIYGGNVNLENVLIQSNQTATNYGGGIYSGAFDGTGGKVSLINCTLDSNNSKYGGGAFIVRGSSITVTGGTVTGNTAEEAGGILVYENSTGVLSNVTVSGNSTTNGDGGGVMAALGSSITATDCFIINNTANGSYSGNTAKVEEHTLVGAGGGVAVFDNSSFSLVKSENGACAIYGNTAATAGNDVFANGNGTVLDIPAPNEMDTSASGIEDGLWWEDYLRNDTSYTQGLNGDSRVIYRYADTPISIRAYTSADEGTSTNGRYVNDNGRFVAITFDIPKYTVGSIKIQAPTASDENQRFVYTVRGETLLGEEVYFSISLPSGGNVTINELLPGTYTVTQKTDWSWRYDLDGATLNGQPTTVTNGAVSVTVEGKSVDELHTVSYTATRTTGIWLDHNSLSAENKAVIATYSFDMAEAKRAYVL